MTKIYYGVYAWNGVGVYTNYERLEADTQIYIKEAHIERFSSFTDALNYALDGFKNFRRESAQIPYEDEIKLNYFYYYRKKYSKKKRF